MGVEKITHDGAVGADGEIAKQASADVPDVAHGDAESGGEAAAAKDVVLAPVGDASAQRGMESDTGSSGKGSGASCVSRFVQIVIKYWQYVAQPQKMGTFLVRIFLLDVIGKQVPIALLMASPSVIVDVVLGRAIAPQREFSYASPRNATVNMHINWMPFAADRPGAAWDSSWIPVWLSMGTILFGVFLLFVAPYYTLGHDKFKEATSVKYTIAVLTPYLLGIPAASLFAASRASDVEGNHAFAIVGNIRPMILVVALYVVTFVHRGWQMSRVVGDNVPIIAMLVVTVSAIVWPMEGLYVLADRPGWPQERLDFLRFVYRLVVWPLIWYVLLVPLERYCLARTRGDPVQAIPLTAYFLVATASSSRLIMSHITNKTHFLIIAVSDLLWQVAMNLYSDGQPIMDRAIIRHTWGRCCGRRLRRSLLAEEDANMAQLLWFQAQSVVELNIVVILTFRQYAFSGSRHAFSLMFTPSCSSDVDMSSVVQQLLVSVGGIVLGDAGTSYLAYLANKPLKDTIEILMTKKQSRVSFFMVVLASSLILAILVSPNPVRVGQCETFDNGCTCRGIKTFYEVCGCCAPNATTSGYEICQSDVS